MASHNEWFHIFAVLKIIVFGKGAHKLMIPRVLFIMHIT